MNIKVLLQALNSTWLLEPTAANNCALVLHQLITGQQSSFNTDDDQPKQFAWALDEEGTPTGTISDASNNSIAVINLCGAVMKYDYCGAAGTQSMIVALQQANDNPNISAIILQIDSPGGAVDGTQQFADAIKNSKKPVVAYINGMMCSAAMWIGSAASTRIASSNTDTIGSIGTMAAWYDYKKAYEQAGITVHEVYASASTEKNFEFRQANSGNYEPMVKTWLDPTNEEFLNAIKQNLPNADQSVLSGASYIATQAKSKGLVDMIGTFADAVKAARSLAKQQETLQQSIKTNQMKWPKFLAFLQTQEIASAEEIKLDEQTVNTIEAIIAERDTLLQNNATLTANLAATATSLQKANQDLTAATDQITSLRSEISSLLSEIETLGKEDAAAITTATADKDVNHEIAVNAENMDFQKQLFSKV